MLQNEKEKNLLCCVSVLQPSSYACAGGEFKKYTAVRFHILSNVKESFQYSKQLRQNDKNLPEWFLSRHLAHVYLLSPCFIHK